MSQPVSAVIIARNEEQNIARCLHSLIWADEIIVVDGGSNDKTVTICQQADAPWANKIRIYHRPWDGFKSQRNYAMQCAQFDWLLVVDADERCTPELAQKITELINLPGGPPLKAYKVRRIEYFLGKEIQYGIWNPSYQDRFFHRAGVKYVNNIHEYPQFSIQPGWIHEALEHSPQLNVELFLQKMNRYTSVEAQDRFNHGMRTHPIRLLFAFPAMFFKNYIYYGAYKDGFHGFIISLLEGVSRVVRHIKIWQLSRTSSDHFKKVGQ